MAWFQLDPQSISHRVRSAGGSAPLPALAGSIMRGALGFMLVSIAGFSPWPIFGVWFRGLGEEALYVACTLVFIGASGLGLHRLILGPGSLWRCYALFSIAFLAYALAWIFCWMGLRGDAGEWIGALSGTAAMGIIFALAFDAPRQIPMAVVALFAGHSIGYELGDRMHILLFDHAAAGMLAWGACYGLGFGAGIGAAFHFCQAKARAAGRR